MSELSTVVKIIPKICECGQRMGYRQKEYEEYLIRKKDQTDKRLLEIEALSLFYGRKMCCLNNFWNSRVPFIKNSNKDSFVDYTGLTSRNNKKIIRTDGFNFVPKIDPPDFPSIGNTEIKTEKIKKVYEEIVDEVPERAKKNKKSQK